MSEFQRCMLTKSYKPSTNVKKYCNANGLNVISITIYIYNCYHFKMYPG